MIGFVEKGEIGVGVVAQPAASRLTYAVRGQGCWRLDGAEATPTRCQVTPVAELSHSTLTQSRSRDPNRRSPWSKRLARENRRILFRRHQAGAHRARRGRHLSQHV
jgi:fructose-1,6-bisphosphatase/inositol monophosphatase family enzyme